MSLVEVSLCKGRLRPIDTGPILQTAQHLLETTDAREELGREPDLTVEDLDESPRTQDSLFSDGRDRRDAGGLGKRALRVHDGGMPGERSHDLGDERALEQRKARGRRGRRAEPFLQILGARTPYIAEADLKTAQLGGRRSEEWKRTAGFEVNPDQPRA